ncbi:MAG TPA: hypothetical protein VHJ20_17580, partial [Polyangia bacterium]|nr:hypothetical protein [Polyangia bacterium]
TGGASGGSGGASATGGTGGSVATGGAGGDATGPMGDAIDANVAKALCVAVDGTYAYWSTDGGQKLQRHKKDGSGTTETFYSSTRLINQITVDADTVYWSETFGGGDTTNGALRSCPQAGCPAAPPTLAMNQQDPAGVAVDDTYIYWCNGGTRDCYRTNKSTGNGGNTIFKVPPSSALDYSTPSEIAADASAVFFAATGTAVAGMHFGTVASCPLTGCTTTIMPTVVGMNVPASGLALDATHVFWTSSSGMSWQADKNGANKVMLGAGGVDIVTDGINVYWSAPNTIYKCAVGGCAAPTALATTTTGARGMAIDATHVYWAEYGAVYPDAIAGGIRRIAK